MAVNNAIQVHVFLLECLHVCHSISQLFNHIELLSFILRDFDTGIKDFHFHLFDLVLQSRILVVKLASLLTQVSMITLQCFDAFLILLLHLLTHRQG